MGCVSSNLLHSDDNITRIGTSALSHHIVSLTSTTYGFLNLDDPLPQNPKPNPQITIADSKPDAIINSWELMAGLDNNTDSFRFPQIPKPKIQKTTDLDKENSNPNLNLNPNHQIERFEPFCALISKPKTQKYPDENSNPNLNPNHQIERFEPICPPISKPKTQKYPDENSNPNLNSNPQIEQFEPICPPIPKPKTQKYPDENSNPNLNPNPKIEQFEPICPPTGENRLVIYTTSLRGVRRTFEACEAVRSAIEALGVAICERDVSMDLGFREELRALMEGKGRDATLPPRVFVKGRYLGGAEEVLRIAEEGHLGHLLNGCPRRGSVCVCGGCGGVGFLTCFHCSGSCKVVIKNTSPELRKKRVVLRCCECNENGLVICPMCR